MTSSLSGFVGVDVVILSSKGFVLSWFSESRSTKDFEDVLPWFSESRSARVFWVFLMAGMAWGKCEHDIPSSADEVCGQKLHYTILKVSFHHRCRSVLRGRVDVMSNLSHWLIEKE